ncbi:MAG TPA: efflux RND transporter permease subunit [Gemmataceae bacterium]|nr:efflux RND transporter permease subunit [Gemmataceae bacterium]
MQRPLATVVIGGVLSSTLLTLLVLPVLYDLAGDLGSGGGIRRAWGACSSRPLGRRGKPAP